jgi:hypothetical protein
MTPLFLAAVLACALMLLTAIAAHLWIISRRDLRRKLGPPYRPQHARAALADPADRTDPDGEQYVRQLREPDRQPVTGQPPPRAGDMPRREPGAQMPAAPPLRTARPDAGLLGELLGALRDWQPGQDIEHTGPLAILGRPGRTPAQIADRLAAKHMGGTG